MANPSDDEWTSARDRIIGLGERSVHKHYYGSLRRNVAELNNLTLTVEQAPVGVALIDRERRVHYANSAFGEVVGVPMTEIIGASIEELCESEDVRRLHERLATGSADGTRWRGDLRFTRGDGERRWGRVSISPIRDEAGVVTHHAVMAEDVTERRETVEQLKRASLVFSSSRDGVLITDPDAVIIDVNAAFEVMSGYSKEELVGRKASIIRGPRHGEAFFAEMWKALARDGHWEGEIWNRKRDDTLYPQWTSISAVRDENGAISQYVAICTDITERRAAEERIRHLAFHDDMTGLPNRFLLERRFETAVEIARRGGSHFALLYVDLDRFKNVNDTLGHGFGDKLLRAAAGRLSALVGPTDTVSRPGGDEFIVLAGEARGEAEAAELAGRIVGALSEAYRIGGHEVAVPASVGIALFPTHGDDLETLLKRADAAMYHAKAVGRKRFRFFEDALDRRTTEFFLVENALRTALRRSELTLHYQPQVDLKHGGWVGMEALSRWDSPELGSVTPDRFIPVAEESGLILELGSWVLDEACRQAAQWRDRGLDRLTMAVNLSMLQFRQDDLIEMVRGALARWSLPPEALELEVTESALMIDADHTIRALEGLRKLGVGLAIDDFGTGYSSLAYLKRFPVDKLKIDKSFVRELSSESDDARICRAIIGLAEAFRMSVVAEGVETDRQRDWLRDAGCALGQGWLFSKAKAPDDLGF